MERAKLSDIFRLKAYRDRNGIVLPSEYIAALKAEYAIWGVICLVAGSMITIATLQVFG